MALPVSGGEVLRRYLGEAIASELNFGRELDAFASDGDDDEVERAFHDGSEECRLRAEALTAKIRQLDAEAGEKNPHVRTSGNAARGSSSEVLEERIAQNAAAAYTFEAGQCARYEMLASIAHAAGDDELEVLTRKLQAQARDAAEKFWKFLASRAMIAFNMLTVSEVDPAVETKVADNRLVES